MTSFIELMIVSLFFISSDDDELSSIILLIILMLTIGLELYMNTNSSLVVASFIMGLLSGLVILISFTVKMCESFKPSEEAVMPSSMPGFKPYMAAVAVLAWLAWTGSPQVTPGGVTTSKLYMWEEAGLSHSMVVFMFLACLLLMMLFIVEMLTMNRSVKLVTV